MKKLVMPIEASAIWKKVVKAIPDLAKGTWNSEDDIFIFSCDATKMQIVFITKKTAKENDYLPGFGACDENGSHFNYFDGTMNIIKIIKGLKRGLKNELIDYLDEVASGDLPYQIGQLVDNIGKEEAQKYLMKLLK